MKKAFIRSAQVLSLSATALLVAPSCTKDLDRTPTYDLSADVVYKDAAGYKTQLAKVYSGFAVTGPGGPNADTGDIRGIDQGTSDYVRGLWSAQELTTDEGVIAWGDPGVQDWHNLNWTSGGVLIRGLYSRLLYEVTICNSYLQESTPDKLSSRGIGSTEASDVATYRAEVRFLRALSYYHLLDLYGNPPFADETAAIGTSTLPPQISRANLYSFIESELQSITGDKAGSSDLLKTARTNEYGRADKGAAYALLAKMYLNGVTYAGASAAPACYTNAATYAKKVVDAGYSLMANSATGNRLARNGYGKLFLADNYQNNSEIIFPVVFDGKLTQTYGGTTFLTHASVSGTAGNGWDPVPYGIGSGWGGIRATPSLVAQFADTTADERGSFHTAGQTLSVTSLTDFSKGYVPIKFRNISSTGTAGSDATFVDTDYPMFRLADMYLTYAEAVSRGGTGDAALALQYVNTVRNRAFKGQPGGTAGAVTAATLTANGYQFFLDERSRELYWEATRRTDLIRFGKFTKNYTWQWKGSSTNINGQDVSDNLQLFPLPSSELSINTNLKQNTGY
ncbi:MAG: RagB/SusD family nutrient uptake outer membrane protein [Hymenobacter sp.]|nr:MAG: RagB/SusD family nutrient uptake outer membrane protein [Hymenobacter sp.]